MMDAVVAPGVKIFATPILLQLHEVLGRKHAAAEHDHVSRIAFAEQFL